MNFSFTAYACAVLVSIECNPLQLQTSTPTHSKFNAKSSSALILLSEVIYKCFHLGMQHLNPFPQKASSKNSNLQDRAEIVFIDRHFPPERVHLVWLNCVVVVVWNEGNTLATIDPKEASRLVPLPKKYERPATKRKIPAKTTIIKSKGLIGINYISLFSI